MEPFKELFNKEFILMLSNEIKNNHSPFKHDDFILSSYNEMFLKKELKERMRHISLCLNQYLPTNYMETVSILKKIKPSFFGLQGMLFQDYVEVFGLNDLNTSLDALEAFTIESSSEFAIRHFIVKYEDETMTRMKEWAQSDNEHIRRLASEGCRPRLPWAIALKKYKENPTSVFEIIELLKNDESLYVRKSVANNLNDISKDNPSLVIAFAKQNFNQNKNLDWIIKHGCRTLLKNSNKEILELFGFEQKKINITTFTSDLVVSIGEVFEFAFELSSKNILGKLRIEYAIDLVRQNNKTSRKVFKLSEGNYSSVNKSVIKKHSFKKVTTRKYYPGKHFLHLIINGELVKSVSFELREE